MLFGDLLLTEGFKSTILGDRLIERDESCPNLGDRSIERSESCPVEDNFESDFVDTLANLQSFGVAGEVLFETDDFESDLDDTLANLQPFGVAGEVFFEEDDIESDLAGTLANLPSLGVADEVLLGTVSDKPLLFKTQISEFHNQFTPLYMNRYEKNKRYYKERNPI